MVSIELIPAIVLILAGIFLWIEKALDFPSILVTMAISYFIWTLRGFYWFLLLFVFFVVAYLSTKIHSLSKPNETHERRTTDNIISNGLVAFMSALFGFPYLYLGSIAAALADTMSSEIGMLSKEKPFLITNPYKTVAPGTHGGITFFGTFAAIIGSIIIASFAFYFAPEFFAAISMLPNLKVLFVVIIISGILGSIIDSIFGALFENNKKLSGGSVNFIATVSGGLITSGIMWLF